MIALPKFPNTVPWFIFDIDNAQLITTPIIPSDIQDSKGIVYAEIQIPGLKGQPIQSGGFANRKISFTLQIINRDEAYGNVALLKQFEQLRVPKFGLANIFQKTTQFQSNPRVLYYWGTGSVPLIYYVTKCDFTHKSEMVNAFGFPKYTDVSLELTLDEFNPINKVEEVARSLSALVGTGFGINAIVNSKLSKRPY